MVICRLEIQRDLSQFDLQADDRTLVHEAKDSSDELEYSTCYTTLCVSPHAGKEEAEQKSQTSEDNSSASCVGIPDYSQISSFSSEHNIADEDEMHQPQQENLCDQSSETSLSQNMEQRENSSITDSICFHVHLANEICTPETHKRKEQIMKAYYLRVEREKGVDTFWYTKKGRVHPKKNPRFEELNFIGKIPSKVNFSPAATEDLLTESESSMDSESEEENLEAPPSLENRPRAKTPEWLVSPERGFKCMACCRVFPSVQVLMEHVEHGVKEGFSCRLFHLSYSWLKAMHS